MKNWLGAATAAGCLALFGLMVVSGVPAADSKNEFVGSEKCRMPQ